jgi:hypothetical protein
MEPIVALVATRPETLPRDVVRVLGLAGCDTAAGCPAVAAAPAVGPHPTGGVPNWTLAAIAAAHPAAGGQREVNPADGPSLIAVAGALHPRLGACACLAALAGAGADDLAAAVRAPQALLERARHAAGAGAWLLVDLTVVTAPDGRAVMRNRLLAGRDPVALDALTARCLGWDPASMPLLRAARAAGWGRGTDGRSPTGDPDDRARADGPARPWRPQRGPGWLREVRALGRRRAGAGRTPWHVLGDDVAAGRAPVWEAGADV